MDDTQEWARFITLLEAHYESCGKEFSVATESLWLGALSGMPVKLAQEALIKHLQSSPYLAKPVDVLSRIVSATSPVPPMTTLWEEFRRKAITIGYDDPHWTHPILGDIAVRLGGWRAIRSRLYPDSDFEPVRRRFEAENRACREAWHAEVIDALRVGRTDDRLFGANVDQARVVTAK